jgi:hypothetical protein
MIRMIMICSDEFYFSKKNIFEKKTIDLDNDVKSDDIDGAKLKQ